MIRKLHVDDLFTSSEIATICSVDVKTIHNWVGWGKILYFRTPGNHLRFRREDVLQFLRTYNYPVPKEFGSLKYRITILAEGTTLRYLTRTLSKDFEVDGYSDTVDALLAIGGNCPDLILVDTDIKGDSVHFLVRLNATRDSLPILAFGSKEINTGTVKFIGNDRKEIKKKVKSVLMPLI